MDILQALKKSLESMKAWTDENKVQKESGKGLSTNDYTTEDKNKVESMAGAIDELNDKIAAIVSYKEITISNFKITNSASKVEKGTAIKSIDLSWSISRIPQTLLLNGKSIDVNAISYTDPYDDPGLMTTKTYTLESIDERGNSVKATTKISFLNGIYYGVIDSSATLDDAAILGLSGYNLQSDRNMTFTVNPKSNQHIIYALPTSYDTPTFTVGATSGGFYKAYTIEEFENRSGHIESYDIWLSDNVGLGETTVIVT